MASNLYCTTDELAAWMDATATSFTTSTSGPALAVETASRQVDTYCGRRFYTDDSGSARTFVATNCDTLRIDDCHTLTALTIDGTTVSLSDYEELPRNGVSDGIAGWPVTALGRLEGSTRFYKRCVVTATWGWAAVPSAIKSATLMLAAELIKAKEAPFGVAGAGPMGEAVRVSRYMNPIIAQQLRPYRTGTAAVPVA